MAVNFTRQLGSQTGVQLNPLRDNSDGYLSSNSDQKLAIAMRLTRGRIDKPFLVNKSNVNVKIGRPESIMKNELNEAQIHVREALNNGAYEAVVYRMTDGSAINQYMVASVGDAGALEYVLSPDVPTTPFLLAIKHLNCYNDGIKLSLHADALDADADNEEVTLRLLDKDDEVLHEFTGSLNPDSLDDYQESDYLPNVVSKLTDEVEVLVGADAVITSISGAYGLDANGYYEFSTSDVLAYFTEGGTGYATEDYQRAKEALRSTEFDYAYIASGGSKSPALISKMAQLALDVNRQFRFDIDGELSAPEAIAFMNSLNLDSHLVHAFWMPVVSNDPSGINGSFNMGASTLNIAMACARNAQTDAKGFAPKNYPIAGKNYPISRTGMIQTYTPSEQELSTLADAKINPVAYETYNGGGRFVFRDFLTSAKTRLSYRKLISVADMSTDIDKSVTGFAKECIALPMTEAVQRMRDFLQKLLEGAESAGWAIPSKYMDGLAFEYEVKPNEANPVDRMDTSFSVHYDGATRQIFVTQTISK